MSRRSPLLASLLFLLAVPVAAQGGELRGQLRALHGRAEALTAELDRLLGAVTPGMSAEGRLGMYQRHLEKVERTPHAELEWQFLGPTNISGRVTDVAVQPARGLSYTMFVATASGGVWRTRNEGTTWEPVFEHAASTSIGALALAPSDPNVIWVGTGEANIFRSSMAGAGVYRSTDGGDSWTHLGLAATHTIARIVVHPYDPDTAWVAASGHEWTDNPERGIYKTTDGGETWELQLFVSDQTGAIDLVLDPRDPSMLYASTWQRRRKRWNDPRAEPWHTESGIWRSDDGGGTWEPINEGLPAPHLRGRIGIDQCDGQPNTLYAFVDNYEDGPVPEGLDSYGRPRESAIKGSEVYRSDDRGATWRKVSESNEYMQGLGSTYGWVFGQIRVDPVDADRIYVMGLALNVSEDGGKTFRRLRGMHGDHHALWIDPQNTDYLVNGNDGGVVVSYDGGANWRQHLDNLPAVQFFDVAVDMAEPFHVYGSIQDHGSRRGVVDLSRGRDRIRAVDFEWAPGGEGSDHAIDPTDPDLVYSAGFYGRISRTRLSTGERVRLLPETPDGERPLRGQWIAPFLISEHNPRILYHGMNRVLRSLDRGDDLTPISPDLTTNDPATRGDISYQTISALAESPLRFGRLYAGTDDGRLHTTPDGGAHWTELTSQVTPERWVSRIVASAHGAGTVWVAQNGKRHDDFTPYLWRSRDFGETFEDVSDDVPSGPINALAEDPQVPGLLYLGTDLGVYVSEDWGLRWDALPAGLPTTFVHDLVVHPRDDVLVAATHGRGIYVLDVRPLQGEEPVADAPTSPPAERPAEDEEGEEDEDR